MTVRELIKTLENRDESLLDKEITIVCPNGLRVAPKLKHLREDSYDFTSDIVEYVLAWE